MVEVPDNYEDQEGMQAQLDNMQMQEDPEIDQNIGEFQEWTAEHEQNVMNGVHNEDMEDTYNVEMSEPALPTDEERYEEEGGAADSGFAA